MEMVAPAVKARSAAATEDFRVRSAARRRERMRTRLLDAIMQVCAQRSANDIVIEDVLRQANVSRGTFYAHFASWSDALTLVGQRLADEAAEIHLAMYSTLEDPVRRMAVGPQLILTRTAAEPAWGGTFARSENFLSKSTFVRAIRWDLVRGMRANLFRRTNVQSAVDLHLGAMLQGAHSLREMQRGRTAYIESVAMNLLMALGVPEAQALATIDWTRRDLQDRGPSFLPWWRSLD